MLVVSSSQVNKHGSADLNVPRPYIPHSALLMLILQKWIISVYITDQFAF